MVQQDREAHHLYLTAMKALEDDQLELSAHYAHITLILEPSLSSLHYYNLGHIFLRLSQEAKALFIWKKTLILDPYSVEAHTNLGNLYDEFMRVDEAILSYKKAIIIHPAHCSAFINFSILTSYYGDMREAKELCMRTLILNYENVGSHLLLSRLFFLQGNFREGWKENEWRWKHPNQINSRRNYPKPEWAGEEGKGGVLLLYFDGGGFGDCIQHCRFALLAKARGWRVILEVPPSLISLLQTLDDEMVVIGFGEEIPHFDRHFPMESLGYLFDITLETLDNKPYLKAKENVIHQWALIFNQEKIQSRMRIGLAWSGGHFQESPHSKKQNDLRSVPLDELKPLTNLTHIQFYSLQKEGPRAPLDYGFIDRMSQIINFEETAGLIDHLDLIISVDTAVAHLAGAVGKPVWLLNKFHSDPRWLRDRFDSPWYRSFRIFQQKKPYQWSEVIETICSELSFFQGG